MGVSPPVLLVLLGVFCGCCFRLSQGVLVGAVVLPHGDFALEPTFLDEGTPERQAADEVAKAARQAGQWLDRTIQPDLVILSSPHGIEVSHDFCLYLGSKATGYADLGGDLVPNNNSSRRRKKRVALSHHLALAPNATRHLLSEAQDRGINATGILSFADSEPMPLRWAEVVPLLLMMERNNVASTGVFQSRRHGRRRRRQHVVLSHPLRRYTESPAMVPELVGLGRFLAEWIQDRPERIAVVVSSDLSHTHLSDGPYGYSPASAKFDAAVGDWATNPVRNGDRLLVHAASLQNKAQSCGFTGLVTLHGILSTTKAPFRSKVWANRNATYYGMMVATFEPTTTTQPSTALPKNSQNESPF